MRWDKMKRGNEFICICGSTKHKDKIQEVQRELTLKGYTVLGMHLFSQDEGIELNKDQIDMLKEKHKLKIDLCDSIYVVNPDGYIGESTKEEIEYAISKCKKIMSLEPLEIPSSIVYIREYGSNEDWMGDRMSSSEKLAAVLAGMVIVLAIALFYYL
jgi:hypothetical protein